MQFYQLARGYRYNSDSLFLYDFAARFFKKRLAPVRGEMLDIGCGCGVVGLLLARDYAGLALKSLDIQPINCQITAKNGELNGISLEVINADFAAFCATQNAPKYRYIVSNPPFYSSGQTKSANEHLHTSRASDALGLEDFICGCARLLNSRGRLFFAYDARRFDEVCGGLSKNGLKMTRCRFVHPRPQSPSKLVLIEAAPGFKSPVEVEPPLFNFANSDSAKTDDFGGFSGAGDFGGASGFGGVGSGGKNGDFSRVGAGDFSGAGSDDFSRAQSNDFSRVGAGDFSSEVKRIFAATHSQTLIWPENEQ